MASTLVSEHCDSSIVGVSVNKIALRIRVSMDDWTIESAFIAGNELGRKVIPNFK